MNRKLLIIGSILLCVAIFVAVKFYFFKSSFPDKNVTDFTSQIFKSSSPDREVVKFAKQMNKHCPTMVDEETRLDKVNALADNSLQFNYTLIYRDRDSVPIGNLKQFMEPVILNKIKNSPTLSKYLNKDLTWVYNYSDKNGDFIFKITYTPDQFK